MLCGKLVFLRFWFFRSQFVFSRMFFVSDEMITSVCAVLGVS
jgi:hypothetical protein